MSKDHILGAGKTAWCLRAPIASTEDQSLVPSTHIKWFMMSVTPAPGALVPSSGLGEHGVHVRFPPPHAEFKNHIFFCFRNMYHFQVPIKQKKRLEFMHIVFICETTLEYVLMEQATNCLLPPKVIVAQCFSVYTSVHLGSPSSSTEQIIPIFW